MQMVKMKDLRLGDVVRIDNREEYSTATVKQIKDGEVHFFRPYTHTADFSYTGGVICYIGIEEFSRPQDSDEEMLVYSRATLK